MVWCLLSKKQMFNWNSFLLFGFFYFCMCKSHGKIKIFNCCETHCWFLFLLILMHIVDDFVVQHSSSNTILSKLNLDCQFNYKKWRPQINNFYSITHFLCLLQISIKHVSNRNIFIVMNKFYCLSHMTVFLSLKSLQIFNVLSLNK